MTGKGLQRRYMAFLSFFVDLSLTFNLWHLTKYDKVDSASTSNLEGSRKELRNSDPELETIPYRYQHHHCSRA